MNLHKKIVLSSAAALTLALGAWTVLDVRNVEVGFVAAAHAQDHGSGEGGEGGGGKGGGGQGQGGQGGGGHGGESGEAGGSHGGNQGEAGKGRPDTAGEDSDGQGPRAGQGGKGDSGGKPSWAQEGIPEVELGRLSVARSPDKVLDRALAEAIANWDPAMANLYNMSAEEFSDYVAANWDTITIYDSPLQNLALMEALIDGTLDLSGLAPSSTNDLASIFLGVASDKTVPISTDTVKALDVIMDLGLTESAITTIAAKAEDVRIGVLEGHD